MKPRFFYGWYMVIAGMIMMALNSSIVSYGWTAFIGPIIQTFGWSVSDISWASAMRSLEIGVFNPMWGPVVHRGNPQKLMALGVGLSAAGLFCLSQTQNLFMYYAGFLVLGIGSSLSLGMLPQTILTRWFQRDLGKANGLFYLGGGLGGVAAPLVVWLIDQLDWRNTLLFASLTVLLLGIPFSFLFRAYPQDWGMVPDGRSEDQKDRQKRLRSDFNTTVREALRMRVFWHLTITTLFQSSAMATVIMFAIPYLTGPGIGMERAAAGLVVSIYTFFSLFGRIITGSLCDYLRKSWVLAAAIALQTAGLILYWRMSGNASLWYIALFALPYGFGVSGVAPIRAPLTAEYFGTRNFASIYGLTSVLYGVGNLVSPPIAAWFYDTYQDYRMWWFILIAMGVIALIAALTMPSPGIPAAPDSTRMATTKT